jgi:hypothetical protein
MLGYGKTHCRTTYCMGKLKLAPLVGYGENKTIILQIAI